MPTAYHGFARSFAVAPWVRNTLAAGLGRPGRGDHALSTSVSNVLDASEGLRRGSWNTNALTTALSHPEAPRFAPAPSVRLDAPTARIPITCLQDIAAARRCGRDLARQLGGSGSRVALVLTAISELARNILQYARSGEILLYRSTQGGSDALVVVARDEGPGMTDVDAILRRSEAETGRSDLGLSGLQHVMDHFSVTSQPGVGTCVTCEVLFG